MLFDSLLGLDEALFRLINIQWAHPFLDAVLPVLRDRVTWIPAYVLFSLWLLWRWRYRGIAMVLVIAASVGLGDLVSSSLVKPLVQRDRPCQADGLSEELVLRVHCGAGKSFTSSHATNHMAMAVAILLVLPSRRRWLDALLITWALSIGYAQVYVGVHYPADILAGALLGTALAFLVHRLARRMGLPSN